ACSPGPLSSAGVVPGRRGGCRPALGRLGRGRGRGRERPRDVWVCASGTREAGGGVRVKRKPPQRGRSRGAASGRDARLSNTAPAAGAPLQRDAGPALCGFFPSHPLPLLLVALCFGGEEVRTPAAP